MPKSIRIRTEPGVDRNINVKIDQDFDSLEILSLKLRQEDLYTQFCADYGVVVGRVVANGGLGIPNAHISIFIPLDEVDENDPIISTLYPYKTPTTKNEDGYRYNLLPYEDEYYGHNATGTFPTVDDVLTRKEVLQVYEKYYKYSVRTNQSGDFMIVGVPLGNQKLVMDLDLSNMGEFSLRPSDLIRMGRGVPSQFNGQLFKDSENIDSLPQIVNEVKDIDVSSFWGQDDVCDVGITRVDFDLSDQGIEITPHATFMGSIFSSNESDYIKSNCRPKKDTGNLCDTVAGPGQILAIRQTISEDENGDPVLEQYRLEDGGNVIDDNGAWLVDLPMNLNYITTNEFGERVTSADPTVGVPTEGKYRFKVKWQNEAGLQAQIMRANYLIPNIKEHWDSTPNTGSNLGNLNFNKSYSFSLDWNDYYDKDAAIKCEDSFYRFGYNKVYTTAAHIDRFKFGWNRASHYGIKEITDRACMSENNRFPTNDGQRNFDFLNFVFGVLINLITPVLIVLLPIMHVLALIYPILYYIIEFIRTLVNGIIYTLCKIIDAIPFVNANCNKEVIPGIPKENPFKELTLPMMTYPDCEACSCEPTADIVPEGEEVLEQWEETAVQNNSALIDSNQLLTYDPVNCSEGSDCDGKCASNEDNRTFIANFNRTIFAGWQGPGVSPTDFDDGFGNGNDVPKPSWFKSPFSVEKRGNDDVRAPFDISWPQAMNAVNQRFRYFSSSRPTKIRTTIINNQYGPITVNSSNNQFEDLPLIAFLDEQSAPPQGQICSFTDSLLVPDPNTSGTTANQFGDTSITGTMVFNNSAYITKTISYEKPNGAIQNVNLSLVNTEAGKSYKFKSGVEYFQVMGTMKMSDAYDYLINNASTAEKNNSVLWRYIFDKICRYYCDGTILQTPVTISEKPYNNFSDDGVIVFLNRGVDPYSPKQNILYDMSPLFGKSYGQAALQFSGEYCLNIPIQPTTNNDTPKRHFNPITVNNNTGTWNDSPNNSDTTLFHESFLFTPDSNQFTSFDSPAFAYYNSMGPEFTTLNQNEYGTTDGRQANVNNYMDVTPGISQGWIAGSSYQYSRQPSGDVIKNNNSNDDLYTISPSYWGTMASPPTIGMTDSNKLIFRSDRLPTSTNRELGIETSINHLQDFALHLNNNFSFFLISENGDSTLQENTTEGISAGDATGGLNDLSGDTGSSVVESVLGSFTCEGLVSLECYEGSGANFAVADPCDSKRADRVVGGCYVFVKSPLIISLFTTDYPLLFEWKMRLKFMFAVCRGVVGHSFQNNWVNGTLYMPSFQKRTFFDSNNEVDRYKYCGDPNQTGLGLFFSDRELRGPIYFNTDSNSFYYRSAPYYNGDFIGLKTNSGLSYIGSNDSNIWQPTTIMDLGPKTDFLKEIMLTPEFQGYIIDKIESTSFQDISGLLNLFVISRLIEANFFEQFLGTGDSAVQGLFSREGGILNQFFDSRVDGDYAQLISINSEFGVLPYIAGNYLDSVTVDDGKIGVWFTGNTDDRRTIGPGEITFSESPLITNQFNYPGAQVVPFYRWKINGSTLFGDEDNSWLTGSNDIKSGTYQDETFDGANWYAKPDNNSQGTGYITNLPGYPDPPNTNPADNIGGGGSFRVGSPFHFYFGLKRGKSAMNKFITKYVFNES